MTDYTEMMMKSYEEEAIEYLYNNKKKELEDIEDELELLGSKVAKANKDNFITIAERMEVLGMIREEILKDIGMSEEEYIKKLKGEA
ncbi:hypothetical protein KAX02_07970 [candidate division WOR-3 bacterium]|nr:hypothetical protein [candidate division WOR-3 bacterium]